MYLPYVSLQHASICGVPLCSVLEMMSNGQITGLEASTTDGEAVWQLIWRRCLDSPSLGYFDLGFDAADVS